MHGVVQGFQGDRARLLKVVGGGGVLQESRIEEESWITLTGLARFTGNTTRIDR
jgi:hypothetical protein